MDSVPSSAILLIVAIVVACLLAGFVFMTVQSQKENGSEALRKVEKLNAELDESEFTQYDGVKVTGSEVITACKMLKDSGVNIYIANNKAESDIGITDGEKKKTPEEYKDSKYSVDHKEVDNGKTNLDNVTKSAMYLGKVYRDETHAIKAITFINQYDSTK